GHCWLRCGHGRELRRRRHGPPLPGAGQGRPRPTPAAPGRHGQAGVHRTGPAGLPGFRHARGRQRLPRGRDPGAAGRPPPAGRPAVGTVDAEVEALYGLPLDEFTRARDALAKERSRGGDKAAATEVKALRKPSLTAWALNHLSRRHPAEIDALLEAGERVRQAQTAALEGDPSGLREASREQAALLQGLADRALALLAEAGRAASPAQQERLAATLRAAAVDPAHGNDLRRGTLTTELSPAGFGFDELAGAL